MAQLRSGNHHVAYWADSLDALQDLDLDAVDQGEGPALERGSPEQRAT